VVPRPVVDASRRPAMHPEDVLIKSNRYKVHFQIYEAAGEE
jgi:hypothetical protein